MKILIIDPSGTTNYCNGLSSALAKNNDVTVVARDNFNNKDYKVKTFKWFNLSNKKKLLKGASYVAAWKKIIRFLKKNEFDVIHIQWLLMYKVDLYFLNKLKMYSNNIVYTAHNVLPHVDGEKSKEQLKKIYKLVDKIIVHGWTVRKELLHEFPEIDKSKIYIQRHGADIRELPKNIDEQKVDSKASTFLKNNTGRVFLYLGVIFYNKGVDRILKFWNKYSSEFPNDKIIIAGKPSQPEYLDQLENDLNKMNAEDSLLFLPGLVNEETHDYLYTKSDLILLPYRHASMSGVVFDAALFAKTILTTKTGCIDEYLINGEDSFVCDNSFEDFSNCLLRVMHDVSDDKLKSMGEKLHFNIYHKYNWNLIAKKLCDEVY